jgi:hypothetical protein
MQALEWRFFVGRSPVMRGAPWLTLVLALSCASRQASDLSAGAGQRPSPSPVPATSAPAAVLLSSRQPETALAAPDGGADRLPDGKRPIPADAYTGTIGDHARLVMRLRAGSRDGAFTGHYFYEAVGEALSVSGTIDPSGHLELTEKTPAGAVSGRFVGDSRASGAIAGTWEAPGGTRRLPFELTPIVRGDAGGPVKVFKRAFRNRSLPTEPMPPEAAARYPRTCDIRVEYPEVFGLESAAAEAKINGVLNAEGERACDQQCDGARSYEVTFNRAGVLSVDVSGWHSCWMFAHPSNFEGMSVNFLTKTGEQLTREQVFKSPFEQYARASFRPTLDALVKDLPEAGVSTDADEIAFCQDMLRGAFDAPDFVFVEGGVRFSVARHLAHAFQGLAPDSTTLTFEQLAAALDPRSPVAFLWAR